MPVTRGGGVKRINIGDISSELSAPCYHLSPNYSALTIIICTLAPVALCLLITSLRKMISVSFMVRSSSLLSVTEKKLICGLGRISAE